MARRCAVYRGAGSSGPDLLRSANLTITEMLGLVERKPG